MTTPNPIVTKVVPLSSIVLDPRLQARVKLDDATITEYVQAIEAGGDFESMDGVQITSGEMAGSLVLWDGWHRHAAYAKIGVTDVAIDVREGTLADAIDLSTAANASHGLRRTNEDKRRAVTMALSLDKQLGRKRSDRDVARYVGVHNSTVSEIRAELFPDTKTKKAKAKKGETDEAATPPKEEPKQQLVHLDELGRKVEDPDVAEALSFCAEFDDIIHQLISIQGRITKLCETKAGAELAKKAQAIKYDLQGAKDSIKFCRPFTTCPSNPNCESGSCGNCRGVKWISKDVWEKLDEGIRAMALVGIQAAPSSDDAPPPDAAGDATSDLPAEVTA